MNVFTAVIAGVALEIHSPLTMAAMGLSARLAPFASPTTLPDLRTVIYWQDGNPGEVPLGDLVLDPGDVWRMHRFPADKSYRARINYSDENDPTSDQMVDGAALVTDSAWERVSLTERYLPPDWQSLLAFGAGELILRSRILLGNGMVFHASGLDDNGRAIVFVGHSGAGKSTQLDFWMQEPGVVGMNDDRIAVRIWPDRVVAYGTPWGGTSNIARNHEAPLAALVLLEQAPENTIERLSAVDAAPLLLPRSYLPFWDPELMGRLTDCLSELLTRVPVFRLRCRREAATIPLVRSVL